MTDYARGYWTGVAVTTAAVILGYLLSIIFG